MIPLQCGPAFFYDPLRLLQCGPAFFNRMVLQSRNLGILMILLQCGPAFSMILLECGPALVNDPHRVYGPA